MNKKVIGPVLAILIIVVVGYLIMTSLPYMIAIAANLFYVGPLFVLFIYGLYRLFRLGR